MEGYERDYRGPMIQYKKLFIGYTLTSYIFCSNEAIDLLFDINGYLRAILYHNHYHLLYSYILCSLLPFVPLPFDLEIRTRKLVV